MATTTVFIGKCSSTSSSDHLEKTRREMEMSLINGSGEKPTLIQKPSAGGRRKTKMNESTQKNKNVKQQRRRGMGVEQLERMRFHERMKMMTADISQNTLPTTTPTYGGYNIINGGYVGLDVQQHSALLLQGYFGNNHGPVVSSGVMGNHYSFSSDHREMVQVDPSVVGSGFRGGNVNETSKELSSIPNNMKWNIQQSGSVCYKKFRGNGENITCNGERKICGDANFCVGNKGNMFNAGNPYYFSKPMVQEVEVMAVHRRGTGVGGGGSVLMEYEFFPGKVGDGEGSSYRQDFIHGVAEAVDLSLKL